MASTEYMRGQAIGLDEGAGELVIGRIVSTDGDSFDLRVIDQGSSIRGEVLTVFHGEIRSGSVIVHRIH